MDTTTTAQAASSITDPAIIGGIIAVAMAAVEALKLAVGYLGRKLIGKSSHQMLHVQLDPEVSKVIHETGDTIRSMAIVIGRTDPDGVPLVYSSRGQEEVVVRIADAMKDLNESQRRLAVALERLDSRFEAHDQRDAITFARLADAQARLEVVAVQNREALLLVTRDQDQMLKTLDDIRKDLTKKP
jgi:hypothetical protein